MDVQRILADIDSEIAKLQGIKATLSGLSGSTSTMTVTRRRGRPKGSKNLPKTGAAPAAKITQRRLSPEGRAAIAAAMKRRWAERRKELKETVTK